MMLRHLKEENIYIYIFKQYSEQHLNMGIFQDIYKK